MSKARYNWWGYVQNMIRDYPRYCAKLDVLHQQTVTANYSGMPGGGTSRATEKTALRELSTPEQRQYDSVRRAVEKTAKMHDGKPMLELVSMVYWKRSHTVNGAAIALNVSYTTANRWKRMFIYSVAEFYGLI